jgi:hypothetical protein
MPISLPTLLLPNGISELFNEVIQAGNIQDAMAISNFLNPIEEEKEEDEGEASLDSLLQEVIEERLGVQATPEE